MFDRRTFRALPDFSPRYAVRLLYPTYPVELRDQKRPRAPGVRRSHRGPERCGATAVFNLLERR